MEVDERFPWKTTFLYQQGGSISMLVSQSLCCLFCAAFVQTSRPELYRREIWHITFWRDPSNRSDRALRKDPPKAVDEFLQCMCSLSMWPSPRSVPQQSARFESLTIRGATDLPFSRDFAFRVWDGPRTGPFSWEPTSTMSTVVSLPMFLSRRPTTKSYSRFHVLALIILSVIGWRSWIELTTPSHATSYLSTHFRMMVFGVYEVAFHLAIKAKTVSSDWLGGIRRSKIAGFVCCSLLLAFSLNGHDIWYIYIYNLYNYNLLWWGGEIL